MRIIYVRSEAIGFTSLVSKRNQAIAGLIVGVLKSMEALREYDNKASFPMDFKLQVVALQFKAGLVGSFVCLR